MFRKTRTSNGNQSTLSKDILMLERGELTKVLDTDFESGLTDEQVTRQRSFHGANRVTEIKKKSLLVSIISQVVNPLALILLCSAVVTYILDHAVDAMIISASLIINILIGLLQEGRAGKAFAKLQQSVKQEVTVVRFGQPKVIRSEDLVVGDVVMLSLGQRIPADVRIVESQGLLVSEAILTGEADDVLKTSEIESTDSEYLSHVGYAGTVVTHGVGKAVVFAVGDATSMASLASHINASETVETPIQKTISSLSKVLLLIVIVIIGIIVGIGLIRGYDMYSILLVGIAVAVSAVPEGLPAAVTVVLALGMERILDKGGLVRNLLAAETLGSTSVILTDKTGTLTKGMMSVYKAIPASAILYPAIHERERHESDERFVLEVAASASDAFIDSETGEVNGRPVEKAILSAWIKGSGDKDRMIGERKDFLPFSSDRRAAYSLNVYGDSYIVCASGSPEQLLEQSTYVLKDDSRELLPGDWKQKLEQFQEGEAGKGYRIIGIAYSTMSISNFNVSFSEISDIQWSFAGWLILSDELRDDVVTSIQRARESGARVVMVTGDNSGTARAIAEQAGIVSAESIQEVITGAMVMEETEEGLDTIITKTNIFARMTPIAKQKVLSAFQRAGHVVAMTGDGVNDAPALSSAHIGIAVGSGTEVAKEASDLVLIDSSFSVIVDAIQEGRRIIDNLRRIIAHLLSTSLSEVILILTALIVGLPLPILPAQILWINIAQGGLLNFAFAFEPASRESMKPRKDHGVITKQLGTFIGLVAFANGIIVAGLYAALTVFNFSIEQMRSIFFIVLSLDTLIFTFAFKDWNRFIPTIPVRNNPFMLLAVGISMVLLVLPFAVPQLASLLSLKQLSISSYLPIGIGFIANCIAVEFIKYLVFQRKKDVKDTDPKEGVVS